MEQYGFFISVLVFFLMEILYCTLVGVVGVQTLNAYGVPESEGKTQTDPTPNKKQYPGSKKKKQNPR